MSMPVPGERPSSAIPAPPPGPPPDRRAARDAVAQFLHVQAAADQVLATARQAVVDAAAVRADEVTAERLPLVPLDTLQETTGGGLRLAPLEQYGITTVGQLLTYAEHELDAIPGVGEATARQALAAANRLVASLRQSARLLPDPAAPTAAGTALLRALHHAVHLQQALRPTYEALVPTADALAPAAAILHARRGRIRWLFTGRAKKDEARDAAATVLAELARPEVVAARAALTAAFATSTGTAYRAPADAELWSDYEHRAADYASVLERAETGTGAATRVDQARGGLSWEIADRVDGLALRCTGLRASLRGYQEFGVKYIVAQERTILGDEMGLGKTVQALGAMTHLAATEGASRFLVVAPASVAQNWLREVTTKTDLRPVLLNGPEREGRLALWARDGGVAIASYDSLRALPRPEPAAGVVVADGRAVPVDLVVADEAHYIKNPDAARTRATAAWMAASRRALLMSGTPLENRLGELVHLIELVSPTTAASLDREGHDGQVPFVAMAPDQFRERVSPVYLRRNQTDVLHELPERIEIDEWVELTPADEGAYVAAVADGNAMAMRLAATIGGGGRRSRTGTAATPGDAVPGTTALDGGAGPAATGARSRSAKLERLEDLLEEYREDERKVIVFSFFRDVLAEVNAVAGGAYSITGDTPVNERMAMVDDFGAQPGFAVMANQIEAGGVGLNLQAASAVILMEPQWKPSTESQAIARAHRMGQTRRVTVHRLLARDSIDEELVAILKGKQAVFNVYARDSAIKDATAAATDISEATLTKLVVEREQRRLGVGAAGTDPRPDPAEPVDAVAGGDASGRPDAAAPPSLPSGDG